MNLFRSLPVFVALAWAGAGLSAFAAPTNAPMAAVESLVVPPPFVAPAPPESVFVIPKNRAEGRDPFFPRSTRVYEMFNPVKTTPVIVKPTADLTLKGISGSKEQPLAIINTTTFTSGEENDVMTKAGKMRIRCLDINMDAGVVSVQVGGERRELRLAALK